MDEMEYVQLLPFENETMRKIGISEYSVKIIGPLLVRQMYGSGKYFVPKTDKSRQQSGKMKNFIEKCKKIFA